jgi:hypothetical protein
MYDMFRHMTVENDKRRIIFLTLVRDVIVDYIIQNGVQKIKAQPIFYVS